MTVPGVGHAVVGGDPSGCGVRKLERFVTGEAVGGDCRRVGTGVPALPLPPRSLRRVAPLRGLGGRVGRTAAAVGVTVDDLVFSLSPAFLSYSGGGLRGGSFAVRRGRVVVRRFSAVRGMWISGSAGRGVLRLRIGGRAAAHGRVTLRSGGRLSGRLGGRAIRVRLPGYATSLAAAAGSGLSRGSGLVRRLRPLARLRRGLRAGERVRRASCREVFTFASGSVTGALTACRSVRWGPHHGRPPLRRDFRGAAR